MGLLHIYCGDGKGKTTASLGLALRAAGAGMKVCFVQFMKGGDTAELETLNLIPDITVKRCNRAYGFVKNMSDKDKEEITVCHNGLLKYAFGGSFDLVILDEFNSAYGCGLMNKELAEKLILDGKDKFEIAITGRNPAEIFLENADYVSEICCVKHPYEKGITARKGIEY
ncbi:MAG: cob(I)yrinic acid a,c-diamide adenosyltransferase [Oscillospiraceae bacterium]|nr:cob(I)yrinic acid a,c-diamide adenosyltransferase [Oscillospiraceae bacterium]MBP1562048.1 cob(I)yrinic acid a,c-diamide adenosyltransferase [Oscillospiraceae bacterium]